MSSEPLARSGDNYVFGAFRLDSRQGQLFRGTAIIPLTPKVVDTLVVLVRNAGLVVTREELMEQVWPDTVVTDTSLSQNILVLRKALGEDEGTGYIETVPRRGYRFNGQVERVPASVPAVRDARPKPVRKNSTEFAPDEISARFFVRKDRKLRLRLSLAVAAGVILGVCLTAMAFMLTGDESSREVREWIGDRLRIGPKNFSGTWDGSQGAWGVVRLQQSGNKVTGTYDCCGEGSSIEGTVTGNRLEFRWHNGANNRGGIGYMDLLYPDLIQGDYCSTYRGRTCRYGADDGLTLRFTRK